MLQIIRPAGEGRFIGIAGTMLGGIQEDNGKPILYHAFNMMIGCFGSAISSRTYQGRIDTNPSKILEGENECFHLNLDGTIYPRDSIVLPGTVTHFNTISGVETQFPCTKIVSGSSYQYTHVVLYGTDFEYTEKYTRTLRSGVLKRVWTDYHVAFAKYVLNSYLVGRSSINVDLLTGKRTTQYSVFWLDFDRVRGYRYKPYSGYLTFDITSSDQLFNYMLDIYKSVKPTGPYTLTIGIPISGNCTDVGDDFQDFTIPRTKILSQVSDALPNQLPDWGELSYQCVNQIGAWNDNGIALTKDIVTLGSQVTSMLKLLKDIKSVKSWASLYLSLKYGVTLTVHDLRNLLSSLEKALTVSGPAKVSSSVNWLSQECQYEAHYGIYYQPWEASLNSLRTKLEQFDLLPELTDLWDLVPFSFVLDWFIDVGNLLSHIDAMGTFSKYNIFADISSIKVTRSGDSKFFGLPNFEGSIRATKYTRWLSKSPVSPSVNMNALATSNFDHWVESGALLVQRLLR